MSIAIIVVASLYFVASSIMTVLVILTETGRGNGPGNAKLAMLMAVAFFIGPILVMAGLAEILFFVAGILVGFLARIVWSVLVALGRGFKQGFSGKIDLGDAT